MVGPSNATNRFGPSSYVVGTPANGLGNGVNFTSIQAAVNQAVADGFGPANPCTVIIRTGVYTEDVTITDGGIHLAGVDDGTFNLLGHGVVINGSLTFNITGANNFLLSNILLNATLGPALSVTGGVIPSRIGLNNCAFVATGFPAVSMTNTSGTFGVANITNCFFSSDIEAIFSSARTILTMVVSNVTGGTNGIVLDGSSRVSLQTVFVQALNGFGVQFLAAANQCMSRFSNITATDSAIDMTPGGFSQVEETTISSTAGSGFFITGTGNLRYCDIVNDGTAIDLDPAIGVITIGDWKPYAEAGAGPAPSLGTVRGTSCFDSAQFTVTQGFVQAIASGIFPWVDQPVSTTVISNQGNFITGAGVTLTLPAAPVQGDVVKFKDPAGNAPYVIQANAGQVLQVGNQTSAVAGTATSTMIGDAMDLTFYAAGNTWCANSVIGNFLVV